VYYTAIAILCQAICGSC